MSNLDSANEKLERSSNTYEPVILSRYECEALIEEHNEMDEAICELEKIELRMEWPVLTLVATAYYLVYVLIEHYGTIYLWNLLQSINSIIGKVQLKL